MSLRTLAISLALTACSVRPSDTGESASDATTELTTTGTTAGQATTTASPTGPDTDETTAMTASSATAATTFEPVTTTVDFIQPPDQSPDARECDPWEQDCPDGQKCMPYANDGGASWNALKCVDIVRDPAGLYEPCNIIGNGVSGEDTCDLGLMCWNVDPDTGEGICHGQCSGAPESPDCVDPKAYCHISGEGILNLCLPSCDPLLQDCTGDDLCLPNPNNNSSFVCILDASGDEGQVFDACEFLNACDKGLLCLDPSLASECDPQALGCCTPFCDITIDPAPCTGQDQVCLPWFRMGTAPPGLENLGACGLPP